MDAYNTAFNYLADKYGKKRCHMTCAASEKLIKTRNSKEYKKLVDSMTDADYFHIIDEEKIPEGYNDDRGIYLLLNQYYLGEAPKIELKNKLIVMGIMKIS